MKKTNMKKNIFKIFLGLAALVVAFFIFGGHADAATATGLISTASMFPMSMRGSKGVANKHAQLMQLHANGHISDEMFAHATGLNPAPRITARNKNGGQTDVIPQIANKGIQNKVFRLSAANTSGGVLTYYFFDQANYRTAAGFAVVPTKVNGGNFGAASNDVLTALATGKPCKLHKIVFQSATGTSVASSSLVLYEVGWNNAEQIQLNYSPTQEQLNTNIYEFKDIDKVIDAGTSGFVTVQNNDTVTLYFHVSIETDAFLMR